VHPDPVLIAHNAVKACKCPAVKGHLPVRLLHNRYLKRPGSAPAQQSGQSIVPGQNDIEQQNAHVRGHETLMQTGGELAHEILPAPDLGQDEGPKMQQRSHRADPIENQKLIQGIAAHSDAKKSAQAEWTSSQRESQNRKELHGTVLEDLPDVWKWQKHHQDKQQDKGRVVDSQDVYNRICQQSTQLAAEKQDASLIRQRRIRCDDYNRSHSPVRPSRGINDEQMQKAMSMVGAARCSLQQQRDFELQRKRAIQTDLRRSYDSQIQKKKENCLEIDRPPTAAMTSLNIGSEVPVPPPSGTRPKWFGADVFMDSNYGLKRSQFGLT